MSTRIALDPPAVCRRLHVTDDDARGVGSDALVHMLLLMHLIREFETRVLELKDADLVNGPVHASIGQEAVAAGLALALRATDQVGSTHRAHGHFLAKALLAYAPADYKPLDMAFPPSLQTVVDKTLAEIMGLREGWCGGRGGSMHLFDAASGNLGSNGIVGGGIPLATGFAWAHKLRADDSIVVSIFGDGAINQGCFHEVANMAALWDVPVLYLVENNLYAVGTGTAESSCLEDLAQRSLGYGFDSLIVDGMDPIAMFVAVRDAAQRMRQSPAPFLLEAKTYRYRHHGGGLIGSAFGYRSKEEEAEWLQRDPIPAFAKTLVRLAVVTEKEDERLRGVAQEVVAGALDFCTEVQDGKRMIPAGKWPPPESAVQNVRSVADALAGVRFSEPSDFQRFKPMTYIQAIASASLRNMQRDERVVVLGEEVANLRGGAYGGTRGIKELIPERLFNTPISETGFIGMAGGLAAAGFRPIVEVMFPDFALMAGDQLFNQLGKLRHMFGGQIGFPIVIRTRVAIGFGYGGQHSMDPSASFALFSGWRIMAPSNAFDCAGMLSTAVRLDDPVLLVEHGKLYGDEGPVPVNAAGDYDLDYYVAYGKANVVRAGSDLTVLTYLTGVPQCLRAAVELAGEGLSAEVIDLRTLDYTGMDYAAIGESVKKTGRVLIVEQAPRSMTLGGRLSDEIQERFFDYLDAPIAKVAALDVPLPVSRVLEATVLPSLETVKERMRQCTGRRQGA